MKNCPKCNDPVQEGETFCGKCGSLIPTGKQTNGKQEANTPAPATIAPKKRKLWPILVTISTVILIGVICIILYFVGILGKGVTIKKFVENTNPDFKKVVEDTGKLEKNLTYESKAQTEEETKKEVGAMKKEIDSIDALKADAEKAKTTLGLQKSIKDTKELNKNLNDFYDSVISSMTTRKGIVDYFYQTQILADKMLRASGTMENSSASQDTTQVTNSLQQFKFALDNAIADFENVNAPEILKAMHKSDIDMLKQISKELSDMVLALQKMDSVGFNSSYTRFTSTLNEYDTKVSKKYKDILDPEFKKLNGVLGDLNKKKDVIEDQYSTFKGKYKIEGTILNLSKGLIK